MPAKRPAPGRVRPGPLPGPVVVVGRGRVGTHLASALAAAGSGAVLLTGKPPRSARGKAGQPVSGIPTTPEPIGLMVLCVPDDALRTTARRLSLDYAGRFRPGAVVLHTSGALCASEIEALRDNGCLLGSWHPQQSFPEIGGDRFDGIRVAVEGDPAAVEAGERLARLLGAKPFRLPRELKVLYHALCTVACSHVAALLLLCRDGVDRFPDGIREEVWNGFLDLARNTLLNLGQATDPCRALTGPAVRGDRRTVSRHLEALGRIDPFHRAVYEVLDRCVQSFLPGTVPEGASGVERALEMPSERDPAAGELLRQLLRRGPAS